MPKIVFLNDMSVFCEAVAQHFPTNFGAKKKKIENNKKRKWEKKVLFVQNELVYINQSTFLLVG